ncbi:unnamed protein product [Acanthosepion pharaonis]|uniref:Uncharacterized protein n=1 Tax=Acanthosepion pharaonis TaxID=158019 RepID=A0A812CW55_ACAPH|nr:unnamed protein product [Sepia pharaonis]
MGRCKRGLIWKSNFLVLSVRFPAGTHQQNHCRSRKFSFTYPPYLLIFLSVFHLSLLPSSTLLPLLLPSSPPHLPFCFPPLPFTFLDFTPTPFTFLTSSSSFLFSTSPFYLPRLYSHSLYLPHHLILLSFFSSSPSNLPLLLILPSIFSSSPSHPPFLIFFLFFLTSSSPSFPLQLLILPFSFFSFPFYTLSFHPSLLLFLFFFLPFSSSYTPLFIFHALFPRFSFLLSYSSFRLLLLFSSSPYFSPLSTPHFPSSNPFQKKAFFFCGGARHPRSKCPTPEMSCCNGQNDGNFAKVYHLEGIKFSAALPVICKLTTGLQRVSKTTVKCLPSKKS